MNKGMIGKKHSKEAKRKIKKSLKGNTRTLGKHWKIKDVDKYKGNKNALGVKRNKEWKEEMSKIKTGDKNPNWKGGISFEPYSVDWTETLKRSIRERDNYICQKCSQYGKVVHHINYNKSDCNPKNLITLCSSCNVKVNFNRKYWKKYFQNNIKL